MEGRASLRGPCSGANLPRGSSACSSLRRRSSRASLSRFRLCSLVRARDKSLIARVSQTRYASEKTLSTQHPYLQTVSQSKIDSATLSARSSVNARSSHVAPSGRTTWVACRETRHSVVSNSTSSQASNRSCTCVHVSRKRKLTWLRERRILSTMSSWITLLFATHHRGGPSRKMR